MKNKKKNNSSLDDFGIAAIEFVDIHTTVLEDKNDEPINDEKTNEKENPIMAFLNRIDDFIWGTVIFSIQDKIWSFIDNHRKHHINFICSIEHRDEEK